MAGPTKRYVKKSSHGDAEYKNTMRDRETTEYSNKKYGRSTSPSSAVKYKTDSQGSQRYSVDSEPSRQRRLTNTKVSASGPKPRGHTSSGGYAEKENTPTSNGTRTRKTGGK